MTEALVIAGAGQAAGQATASLRQKGYEGRIVMIGDAQHIPYQRPPLSKKYLAGEIDKERLYIKPERFYPEHDIEIRLETRIESIDRGARSIHLSDNSDLAYSKLLLATGSRARNMSAAGAELNGIFYLRGIVDVLAIQPHFKAGRKLVIVGAGYIGLEVAAIAVKKGLEVTIIETEQRVMNRVVAPPISSFFQQAHEEAGVKIEFGRTVKEFRGDGTVSEVVCTNGESFAADFCIVGIGNLPNQEIAAEAGIDCDNGIVVNEFCQTSDLNVLAAGDCTRHPNALIGINLRLESVHNAIEQSKTAAATICGTPVAYNQIPWFWSDQYDLKLQIVGLSNDYDQFILRGDPASRSFAGFYLQGDKLLAVDAINSPREFMLGKKLIKHGARIAPQDIADNDKDFKSLATAALAAVSS
jgi:3-phenylpropionate/trans-cinnamate dioxygenase ferredoxin reductase subunit